MIVFVYLCGLFDLFYMKRLYFSLIVIGAAVAAYAADYSYSQCEGSLTPYPSVSRVAEYPDSLVPVFINHVGRHGARYPASAANCLALRRALHKADSLGTITQLGKKLNTLNEEVIRLSNGRWGALDSLGIAEQAGIAASMFANYTEVFHKGAVVEALSSYSPRAMMSMYSFVHQLDKLNNNVTFTTSTGHINSALMRPFDVDADYLQFRKDKVWEPAYRAYFDATAPTEPIKRVLGAAYPFAGESEMRELSLVEYYVLAGFPAMSLPNPMADFLTPQEANALWSCFNLRQYLQRTSTTVSSVPADIASALVQNIIETTDNFINGTNTTTTAMLRFGHAETIMPLVSLLRLPGCYYLTNYFDTVREHWLDFEVVPMASNVQFILFRAKVSGRFYVRIELNERPLALRQGDEATIFPWGEVRRYLTDCIPLYRN